jgi:hypothetical protein
MTLCTTKQQKPPYRTVQEPWNLTNSRAAAEALGQLADYVLQGDSLCNPLQWGTVTV